MSCKNQTQSQEALSYFLLPLDIDQSLIIMKLELSLEREDEISFISNIINEFSDFSIYIAPYSSEQNKFGYYYSQAGIRSMDLQSFYEEDNKKFFIKFVVNTRNKSRIEAMVNNAIQVNKIMKDIMGEKFGGNSYSDHLYNTTIQILKSTGLASSYI